MSDNKTNSENQSEKQIIKTNQLWNNFNIDFKRLNKLVDHYQGYYCENENVDLMKKISEDIVKNSKSKQDNKNTDNDDAITDTDEAITDIDLENFKSSLRFLRDLIVKNKNTINFLFGNGISIKYGSKNANEVSISEDLEAKVFKLTDSKIGTQFKEYWEALKENKSNKNVEKYFDELAKFLEYAKIIDIEKTNELEKMLFTDEESFQKNWLKKAIGDIDYTFSKGNQIPLFVSWLFSQSMENKQCNIFTLNYDVLIESAADKLNFEINNGFSGNLKRKFNIANYNVKRSSTTASRQSVPKPNVRLANLHGSISWGGEDYHLRNLEFDKEGKKIINIANEGFAGIMPSANKHKETISNIFTDLFRFFKNSITEPKSSLVVMGYSLGDEHINSIIFDAIDNSKIEVIIFYYGDIDDENNSVFKKFMEKISNGKNVTLVEGKLLSDFTFVVKNILYPNVTKEVTESIEKIIANALLSVKAGESND